MDHHDVRQLVSFRIYGENSAENIGEMGLGKTFPSGFNLQQRPTQFAICRPKRRTVSVRSREGRWNRKRGKGG